MAVKKYVYKFSEGDGTMRELLGGKGANLAEMSKLGMPVPNGFTITTEGCTAYYEDKIQRTKRIKTKKSLIMIRKNPKRADSFEKGQKKRPCQDKDAKFI